MKFICLIPEQSDIYVVDGRVLLQNKNTGVISTVCSNNWGNEEATVICKQLGLGDSGIAFEVSRNWEYSRGLFDVKCTGSEDRLTDCSYASSDYYYICDFVGDAAVSCIENGTCRYLLLLLYV